MRGSISTTTSFTQQSTPKRKPNMTTPTTKDILVPLNKLVASPSNVRKRKSGGIKVEDLAAMILAQGLLHRLTVVVASNGKRGFYEVPAGERRRQALLLLVSQKKLAKDALIECKLVDTDAATAASLAENIGREAMHPADQFLAFQALSLEGKSTGDIAAAFGVSELTVTRRMKLAQVSPVLFELFATDKMNLEQLMTFTLTDDHDLQERVWKAAEEWQRTPRHLRQLLTGDAPNSSDPLVRFVGLAAYKKAGGEVRKDLFSPKDGGFITDVALLNQLAIAKLETIAETYRAAGWKWVEARPRCDHGDLAEFRKSSQGRREPTATEQEQLQEFETSLAAKNTEIDALENAEGDGDADQDAKALDDLYQQVGKLEGAQERLTDKLATWTAEQLVMCGVIVCVNTEGEAHAHVGLVRPEDHKELKRTAQASGANGDDTPTVKPEHSEKLTRNLTAHRNAALQALLLQNPNVATVSVVHSLVLQCFDAYQTAFINDPLKIRATTVNHTQRTAAPDIEQSVAGSAFAQAWAAWEARLPAEGAELFAWLLKLSSPDLHSLLTLCVAASIDTIASRATEGVAGAGLASVLGLDMADWWKPTGAGYLAHIPKTKIIAAVTAATSADTAKQLPSKGKAELVSAAEKALIDTRWLPDLLRG
jgi:ParB family transcriptional regulator, chromosome partitioning protein